MVNQDYIDKFELKLKKLEHHMVAIKREINQMNDVIATSEPHNGIDSSLQNNLSKRKKHASAVGEELSKLRNEYDSLNLTILVIEQHLTKLEKHLQVINKDLHTIENHVITDPLESFDPVENPVVNEDNYKKEKTTPLKETEPKEEVKQPKEKTSFHVKTEKNDIESFIGKNVISKVGIALLVLGVGIGTKYAIDHHLISPLVRIIAGYSIGGGLLLLSVYLKKKYENFATVLFSGAMTIVYFITYFAFAYYHMMGREIAFGLMILFTLFTVFTAIRYDKQFIAHFGLVGSYAIPFLISANSNNANHLFIYMTIINSGILFVSIKKYWISLYYSSFALTWLIYAVWFLTQYHFHSDFSTALTFSIVFYLIFYVTLIGYKVVHSKVFDALDIVFVSLNSVIFFGFGYAILDQKSDYVLAGFSLANGAIHLIANVIAKQFVGYDKNFSFFTIGLSIAFVTITAPILTEGNWLAGFWSVESAVLFWIGRKQKVQFYEIISYPLIGFSLISMIYEWGKYYSHLSLLHTPFNNEAFTTSLIILGALCAIRFIAYQTKDAKINGYDLVVTWLMLGTLYMVFFLEINAFWELKLVGTYSNDLWFSISNETKAVKSTKAIWLINYSIVYLSLISWVNILKFKSFSFGTVNLLANSMMIVLFLLAGLYEISYRPELNTYMDFYFMRYISLGFFFLLMFTTLYYAKQKFITLQLKVASEITILGVILWVLTSELFNWAQITHLESFYKSGLSLLWGIYGFALMIYGIAKKTKYLRITAISLFGLTILKLFFYDLAHLNTLAKTVIMISMGIILLIVSFLYNKYVGELLDKEEE